MGDVDTKKQHVNDDDVEHTVVKETSRDVDTRFGIGRFKPRAIQRFATVSWFTAFFSIAALTTSTLIVYVNSQITTLERQFGFSSKQTGLIMAANDIGYLVCVLFVAHTAKMIHIPRALGWATIIFGLSGLTCSLPHFIYGSIFIDDVSNDNVTSFPAKEAADLKTNYSMFGQLCSFNNRSQILCQNKGGDNKDSTSTTAGEADRPASYPKGADNKDSTSTTAGEAALSSLVIIVVGMMLQGFGKAPRASFTIIYIDDNTRRVKSGFYIGIMVALSIMGPAVAYAMGGVFSRMYVTLEETTLNPKHPKWIGAWWLGFLVFGGIAVIVSLPLFCFPAKLPKKGIKNNEGKRKPIYKGGKKELEHVDTPKSEFIKKDPEVTKTLHPHSNDHQINNNNNNNKINHSVGKKEKGEKRSLDKSILRQGKLFLASVFRIITNPIFVLMVASSCFILFMVGGSSAYSPKYLERVFDMPAYKANYIMAGKTLLSSVVGTFIGGYLTRRYKMTAKKALYFTVIMSFVSTLLSLMSLFAYCDQPVVYNWPGESDPSSVTCHGNCHCEKEEYFPVCGGDGKTYYSPCMAGCGNHTAGAYSNCSCIEGGQAKPGICPYGCDHVYFFAIVSGLRSLFGTLCIVPKVTVLIRTVEERDKSLALGMSSFFSSMLGWLLGPVVFGILIDGICSLWDSNCGVLGRCLLYDNDLFRWKLNGVSCLGIGGAFVFQLLALVYSLKTKCLDDIGVDGRVDEVEAGEMKKRRRMERGGEGEVEVEEDVLIGGGGDIGDGQKKDIGDGEKKDIGG